MATAGDRTAVLLKNVLKRREKGGNVFELSVPSLSVRVGEFVAIVGESGCGKSTLLDMLGLVMSPTSADEFKLCIPRRSIEHDILSLSPSKLAHVRQQDLGYVLQTGGLLPFLKVRDNILLPCWINGQRDAESRVMDLCQRLKIEGQLGKKPQFLSGGQRQRVAIARALAHQPPIVLADEPTAAVDRVTAREIRDTFKALTRQMGVTLLMVTHDLALLADVVDRIFTFEISKKSPEYTVSVCRESSQHPAGGKKHGKHG